MAPLLAPALGLDATQRGLLFLFGACRRRCSTSWSPSSSGRSRGKVASIVLIGNVLSVVFVPLGLALALLEHERCHDERAPSTRSCSTWAAC